MTLRSRPGAPALGATAGDDEVARDHLDRVLTVVTLLACVVLVVLALGRSLVGVTVFASTDVLYQVAPWSAHVDAGFAPQNPYVQDPVDAALPGAAEIGERLRGGDFAQWSSLQSGGHELAASHGLLAPTALPSFVLPPWLAPGYQKLLDLVIAIGGTYLLARRLGLTRSAGVIGGLAFATSGFLVVWTNWPQARVAALIPAVFWAIERLLQVRSGRNVALLGVVTAAMVLVGFPSVVAYTLLTAVPYVVVRVVGADRSRPKRMIATAAMAAAGVGLGVLLAAAQLLPFFRLLGETSLGDRSQQGDFETLGSLVTMLVPNVYGTAATGWDGPRNVVESMSYAGVAVVLLAVIGLLFGLGQRHLRWVVAVLVGSAVFWGVVMYAGGPVLLALQELPVFDTNRIGRARSVLGFLVAMLAAVGVDALVRGLAPARASTGRRLAVGVAWTAAAAAAVGLVRHGLGVARQEGVADATYRDAVVMTGLLLVAAVAAVVLVRWGRRGWRVTGLVALPVLVLGPALALALPFWPQVPREQFYPQTPTHRFLAESLGPDRFVSTKGAMMPGTSVAYGLRALNGHAFTRTEFADLLDVVDPDGFGAPTLFAPDLPDVAAAGHLLDRLGVRYLVAPPSAEVPGRRTVLGAAGGTLAWQPGTTASVEIPAAPLRGIGVTLLEPPSGLAVQVDVRVVDEAGDVVLSGSRQVGTDAAAGDLVVALAGQDLDPDPESPLTAELTLRGDQPLVVAAGSTGASTPRLVVVEPADDGLRLLRTGEASIYERPGALSRIRWAGTSVVEPDAATTIAMLANGAPADVVLAAPGPSSLASSASLDVVEDSGDTIRVAVEAQAAGYLVVADALHDSFVATVDGESAELRVADHALVAVAVPAGAHVVELNHRQPYGGAGVAVSAGAALAAIMLTVVSPARGDRRRWFARRTAPR